MTKIFGSVRGEDVVKEIMLMNKEFKLSSDIDDGKHYIFETFPTGICLGLFPEVFPIKYKIKNKIPISESKVQMHRMIKVLNNLQRFSPCIKTVDKYSNSSIDIDSFSKTKIKHLEDKLDAFLCAYCAYWHYEN